MPHRSWITSDPYDRATGILLAGLLALVILVFRDYGISNDEEVQHRYGELIVNYYSSGFADADIVQLQESLSVWRAVRHRRGLLAKILPFDLYLIRHFLCAMIGIGGDCGDGGDGATDRRSTRGTDRALARRGLRAVFRRHVQPHQRHSVRRGDGRRDLFPAARDRDLPAPRWRDVVGFGLMLGAAIGLRAMGLLLVGYARWRSCCMSWSASRVARNGVSDAARFVVLAALRFCPAFAIGLPHHDRGMAMGVRLSRSIRCARFSPLRISTMRSAPSSPARFTGWRTCRGGMSRSIS